jgi:hypothetical protein
VGRKTTKQGRDKDDRGHSIDVEGDREYRSAFDDSAKVAATAFGHSIGLHGETLKQILIKGESIHIENLGRNPAITSKMKLGILEGYARNLFRKMYKSFG